MGSVGPGVREIRIHAGTEHRILYVANFSKGVYVLHAFEKRTRKTMKKHVDLARARYRDLWEQRRRGAGHARG